MGNTGLKLEIVSYTGTRSSLWATSQSDMENYQKTIKFSQPIKFMFVWVTSLSNNAGALATWGIYNNYISVICFPYATTWTFNYNSVPTNESKVSYQICLKASSDSSIFYYTMYQTGTDSNVPASTLKIWSNVAGFDMTNNKYSWYGFY